MAMLLADTDTNTGVGTNTRRGTNTDSKRADDRLAEPLIAACNTALARVLDSGAASRDSALDLLSADAFVTYAFEAAADAPESIGARCDAAMRQISDLALARLAPEPR